MSETRVVFRDLPQTWAAIALGVATAACWWGWTAWHRRYVPDPMGGTPDGSYEPWQLVGCVLCLVAVAVIATRWLPAWLVIMVMPVAFTTAWSLTAVAAKDSGPLFVIGAILVFVGMVCGTTVVAGVAAAGWRLAGRRR